MVTLIPYVKFSNAEINAFIGNSDIATHLATKLKQFDKRDDAVDVTTKIDAIISEIDLLISFKTDIQALKVIINT